MLNERGSNEETEGYTTLPLEITSGLERKWPLRFWNNEWPNIAKQLEGTKFFPRNEDIFRALELTPYEEVKVVILGQDPYPTKGHADGLAFSTYPHVAKRPASLRNIFMEYTTDTGFPVPRTGDLSGWASNGVLLLNTSLTVEEGKPLSHQHLGWSKLTYEIISRVQRLPRRIVFILWGNQAQEYRGLIDGMHHGIITSSHPSPFSANLGFFGSKPFTTTNDFLLSEGQQPINWRLP